MPRLHELPRQLSTVAALLPALCVIAGCAQSEVSSTDATALASRIAELEHQVEYQRNRQQISDIYVRFARGFDRQDEALIKSVFWPEAPIYYGNQVNPDRDTFIAEHLPRHKTLRGYAHHISTQSVDIDGDVAHVESYNTMFIRTKDNQSTIILGGRSIDRLDRRAGEWRIAVREFIPHFSVSADSNFDVVFPASNYSRTGCWLGTWDKRDLSYRRPLLPRESNEDPARCTATPEK